MMKLAYRVLIVTLALFVFSFTALAQSQMTDKDPRNTAPTVGTGGPIGGPTGLFTVYDGKTLRKAEHTLSIAWSNFDRDPGNADFNEVPISFQIGVWNTFEVFFTTDMYKTVKVNSPRNLSSFYLPNTTGFGPSFPAIVLAPDGGGAGILIGQAIFRPTGTQPNVGFPYIGGSTGNFGSPVGVGHFFGFPFGSTPTIGLQNGGAQSNFTGMGSIFGSILPGIVLQTVPIFNANGSPAGTAPSVFTTQPSYLPDAPFINQGYGTNWFNTFTAGAKWRWTGPDAPVGVGIMAGYRWYRHKANDADGWAALQSGSSPGGSKGDILTAFFVDARPAKWVNVSANVGFNLNSSVRSDFEDSDAILLDRPNELMFAAGVDFPINQWFQPIVEIRTLRNVGGRTPNAFENDPTDIIGGFRIFPKRWFGFGFAYRHHWNQQDEGDFDATTFDGTAFVQCFSQGNGGGSEGNGCTPIPVRNQFQGVPPGFLLSENPHGFIVQAFVGRRNPRLKDVVNQFANVTGLTVSDSTITLGCPAGSVPREGRQCNDNTTVQVATTAVDPENDVLTYNYTVSGGRIVGTGANVQWDLSGLGPGTYTVTAGVDDGCGLCGKTETRTVTVENCDCIPRCACATLSVSDPAGVTSPGETMTFTANVSGGPDVTYNWTVSSGSIESGQGTASIVVRTALSDAGTTITATVTLGGLDPACQCPSTANGSGPVAPKPESILVDEFGKMPNDDIRGRLDNFFTELQNNPNNQGYIINYGTDKDIAARERLITNHINFRKFDRSRITLVRGGDAGDGVKTKLYRIPPGAENPAP